MLELRLFGIPELILKNNTVSPIDMPYGKALALLAYLLVEHERWHSRNELATLLWDSMEDGKAKRNLRQAIYVLRHLTPDDVTLIEVEQKRVRISTEYLTFCDVLTFAEGQVDSHSSLEVPFAMYRGTFLEGLSLDDCDAYEEWLRLQRSRFQIQAISTATRLLDAQLSSKDYDAARITAEKLRQIESMSEIAYQYLMRVYASTGEIDAVRQIYKQCAEMCRTEYASEPSDKTSDLFQQLFTRKKFESHLPDVDPLIGREHLLDSLDETFNQDGRRLVSLTGMGGTGKTHLALSYGHRVRDDYDAVCFVPIFENTTETDLVHAIADVMQLPLYREQDVETQLINQLKSLHVLLIIDNYEYLIEHRTFLETLLTETTQIKLLVTSRLASQLDGETAIPLSGLSHDEPDNVIRLFEISARRINPDFKLTTDDRKHVEIICEQVEGLPLAIILAASWTSVMSVSDIATEMQDSLQFLGMSGQLDHIKAVFERSWKLLSATVQGAFVRLCIFRTYFKREAAEAICQVDLTILKTLIDSALVRYLPDEKVYSIHELLRQYGEAYLTESSDYVNTRAAFRHYYQKRLDGYLKRLRSDGQSQAMSDIEAMLDNLRLMWQFAIDDGDVDVIASTGTVLYQSFELSNRFEEGILLFQKACDQLPQLPDSTRAVLYEALGTLYHRQSRYEEAMEYYELAKKLSFAQSPILPGILSGMAATQRRMGQYEKAESLYQQALPLATHHQDDWQMILILNGLGGSEAMQAKVDNARAYFEQSLALARRVGDPYMIATSLAYLGNVYGMSDEFEHAERAYYESLDYYQTSRCLSALASVLSSQGKYDEAAKIRNQAIELCQKTGEDAILAVNLNEQGVDYLELGNFEQSLEMSSRSYRIRRDINNRRGQIHSLTQMAFASIYLDRRAEGEQYVGELMQLAEGSPYEVALALELACLFALQYDSQDIDFLMRDFKDALDVVKYPIGQANYHNFSAMKAIQHDDYVLALRHFEEAIMLDSSNQVSCITYSILCQAIVNPHDVDRDQFFAHLEKCLLMKCRPEVLLLLLASAYLQLIDFDLTTAKSYITSQSGLRSIDHKVFVGNVDTSRPGLAQSPEALLENILR